MNRELCIQLELFSILNSFLLKGCLSEVSLPNIRNTYSNVMFKRWMNILLDYINLNSRYFDSTYNNICNSFIYPMVPRTLCES